MGIVGLRVNVTTDQGMQASYDGAGSMVRVGDLYLPTHFEMSWPGAEGHPGLEMTFAVIDGVPQCREVRIRSVDDGRPVRTADLRALRMDDFTEAASVLVAQHWVDTSDDGVVSTVTTNRQVDVDAAFKTITAARKDSRRRITDDLLREVAEVYRGTPGPHPTKAVADHFEVKSRTAGDYVRAARDKGFLGPAAKGKAGGR